MDPSGNQSGRSQDRGRCRPGIGTGEREHAACNLQEITAESFLFNDARKSSNCPISKCVFVLICKYTNALMCVCVYVLMHLCSCVLMYLCAYVLMCSTKLSTALPPSKFYRFFGRKRSGITPFFKTSKHLFQPRFHLSVSPDCKMCVRVTNTGQFVVLVL